MKELNVRKGKYSSDSSISKSEKPTADLKVEKSDGLDLSSLKKKDKKNFTLVRIEDDIVEGFRNFARLNKLESHGPVMNRILRNFLEQQ